jgi:Protein of unknown function (DUF2384)
MSAVLKSEPVPIATGAVLTKAMLRASERLQIPASQLSEIIGVSEAGISRMRSQKLMLESDSKPFELALIFVRLFRALDAIVGGDEKTASAWLRNHNLALGETPLKKIRTISGLTEVLAYLDARRALV